MRLLQFCTFLFEICDEAMYTVHPVQPRMLIITPQTLAKYLHVVGPILLCESRDYPFPLIKKIMLLKNEERRKGIRE